jgi:superfamily II DNA or RNA helicase
MSSRPRSRTQRSRVTAGEAPSAAPAASAVSLRSALAFRYSFRKYQHMIFERLEADQSDHRYHIVAPPGSGKTIVGIELVRRCDAPAVIFAPTRTIQQQWREKLELFLPDQTPLDTLSSLEPNQLAPINCFTYQLLATPGEAQEGIRQMARQSWLEELLTDGRAADPAAAEARLQTLQRDNPDAYAQELAHRHLRVKREFLRHDSADVTPFLHANARKLIDDLVTYGVRTIVLDECHHLLAYWAIVLRHFISRVRDPVVIGLTATLPNPEDEEAYENYTSLLGEVDFETPTPAIVQEGGIAPYRDLVYFVEPSERESAYLHDVQSDFEAAIAHLTEYHGFREWVTTTILDSDLDEAQDAPPGDPIMPSALPQADPVASQPHSDTLPPSRWQALLRTEPSLALAGLRFLWRIHHPATESPDVLLEARRELAWEDWITLLERYGLERLKLSPDAEDHEQLATLRRVIRPFGFALTEHGLHHTRSPGDLVLSLSESKDRAAARILAAESYALGERLRAMVVTDFEHTSAGASRALDALDLDSGGARRIFQYLVLHPETSRLHPVLVTGQTLWIDAAIGPSLVEQFNEYLGAHHLNAVCQTQTADLPDVLAVVGAGVDWSSGTYVQMVTAAFEQGLVRCLVGTRGIFGEGWDSPVLNTLIDLTSVTTSAAVQQLRGRSIRKDPAWARKVAHNWDVVCVATEFDRGDLDLRRFVQRHERFWGIAPAQLYPGATDRSQIIKGVAHVDHDLAAQLAFRPFQAVDYQGVTARMLLQVPRREQSYDLWQIAEEYSNTSYPVARLDTWNLKVRTVYTVQNTLARMVRSFWGSAVACMFFAFWSAALRHALLGWVSGANLGRILSVALGSAVLATITANARSAYHLARGALIEQRPDAILLDIGRALLAALQEQQLIDHGLALDAIRLVVTSDGAYEVRLAGASPADASTFITAYREIFAPVRDQRYLILWDDSRLPHRWLGALWRSLRRWMRQKLECPPAYYPVPQILAAQKARAECFARCWRDFIGGGDLVYTRDEAGWRVLLQARAQARPDVPSLAFEVWA